jgi:hypothetical protein
MPHVPHPSKITNNVSDRSHFYGVKSPLRLYNHQAIYVRSIQGNHTPAVYIKLQMISERYFGLTYKGM